jgi:hypothetical protein
MDTLVVRGLAKAFGVSSFRSSLIVMTTYHTVPYIHTLGGYDGNAIHRTKQPPRKRLQRKSIAYWQVDTIRQM